MLIHTQNVTNEYHKSLLYKMSNFIKDEIHFYPYTKT